MYKIYLGINGGEEGFILPVLPEKIEFTQSGNNKTYDVISLGEINTIGTPKLTDISFESFFPKYRGNYVSTEQLYEPDVYLSLIKKWRDNRQKIRFIFVGGPLKISDLFTIENFKYREESGQVGDVYYSIDLKMYKNFAAKKATIVQPKGDTNAAPAVKSEAPQRPVEKAEVKSHTVVKGDTLFFIAKKYLGDGNRWREIYELNKDIIKVPKYIYEGQVFKLP